MRYLGDDPATGQPVLLRSGPYQPYLQRGIDADPHVVRAQVAKVCGTRLRAREGLSLRPPLPPVLLVSLPHCSLC
jgi:topoisomerase IA-like protein